MVFPSLSGLVVGAFFIDKIMKTIKELLPELSSLERCRVGELTSKLGIKRVGEKIEENGIFVCRYDGKYYDQIIKLATKKKRKRMSNDPTKINY